MPTLAQELEPIQIDKTGLNRRELRDFILGIINKLTQSGIESHKT